MKNDGAPKFDLCQNTPVIGFDWSWHADANQAGTQQGPHKFCRHCCGQWLPEQNDVCLDRFIDVDKVTRDHPTTFGQGMFNSGFSQSVEKLSQIVEPPFDDIVSILCLCFKVQKIRDVTFGNCALVIHDHLQNDLKIWKADSSGAIRATNKDPALAAVLNTELDVHHALRRRGVAYEIAQAMTFEVHESIINYFFFELKKEPMEGFAQVTLQQVAAADRELHVRLAEATRAGFRNGPAGELPLDLPAKAILEGPELKWLAKAACGKNTSWRCPWKDFTGCRTQKDQGGAKQEQTRGTPDQKVEKDAYAEEAGRLCALQRGRPANLFWVQPGHLLSLRRLSEGTSYMLQEGLQQATCLCHSP